jgi:3-hydroxyisobutyrate dehydrogenase
VATIAFLGLGNMGAAMAARLIRAGHELRLYNRTPAKARRVARLGGAVARTPREAAEGAEIVFAMVGDDRASRRVWLGPHGALAARLAPRARAVECSTLSQGWIQKLARHAAARGVRFVDCPVTGVPSQVTAGELILLVGAAKPDLAALRPVFADLAKEVVHFGPVGAGNAYKLMINLMGSVQIGALAEGLVLAERAGLDPAKVVDALSRGAAASPQVVRNALRMRDGDHHRNIVFSGRLRLKDTLYGLDLARRLGFDARFGKVAARALRELVASGGGEENESKVIEPVRKHSRPRRRTTPR